MVNFIVLAVIGAIVFFAVRALRKKHKSGGGCDGNCGGCGCGCG